VVLRGFFTATLDALGIAAANAGKMHGTVADCMNDRNQPAGNIRDDAWHDTCYGPLP